jgi:hypothetical protein
MYKNTFVKITRFSFLHLTYKLEDMVKMINKKIRQIRPA